MHCTVTWRRAGAFVSAAEKSQSTAPVPHGPLRHLYEEEDKEPPKELPPKNSDEFPHLGMQQQHQRTLSRERELDLEGGGSGGIVPLEVEGPLRKTGSMKRKKETEETASLLAPGGASPGVSRSMACTGHASGTFAALLLWAMNGPTPSSAPTSGGTPWPLCAESTQRRPAGQLKGPTPRCVGLAQRHALRLVGPQRPYPPIHASTQPASAHGLARASRACCVRSVHACSRALWTAVAMPTRTTRRRRSSTSPKWAALCGWRVSHAYMLHHRVCMLHHPRRLVC